jgi:trimeric autotransporter adhesin
VGTLQTGVAANTAAIAVNTANISANTAAINTHSAQIGTLNTNVAALQSLSSTHTAQIDTLFALTAAQREEYLEGIASVAAMAQPHFPSAAGKTSYASNVAYYRGELGLSLGLMHRMEGDFGISAGVSYAGKHAAVKAGVAGEF